MCLQSHKVTHKSPHFLCEYSFCLYCHWYVKLVGVWGAFTERPPVLSLSLSRCLSLSLSLSFFSLALFLSFSLSLSSPSLFFFSCSPSPSLSLSPFLFLYHSLSLSFSLHLSLSFYGRCMFYEGIAKLLDCMSPCPSISSPSGLSGLVLPLSRTIPAQAPQQHNGCYLCWRWGILHAIMG